MVRIFNLGANLSFCDICLEELSTIPRESIDRDTYLEMIYRLRVGRSEPSLATRLSRRSKAIFNMNACADGRPCVINPTIPVTTVEDRQKLCQTSDLVLEPIPSDIGSSQHTRKAV